MYEWIGPQNAFGRFLSFRLSNAQVLGIQITLWAAVLLIYHSHLGRLGDFAHLLALPLLRDALSIPGAVHVPAHGQHAPQRLPNGPPVDILLLRPREEHDLSHRGIIMEILFKFKVHKLISHVKMIDPTPTVSAFVFLLIDPCLDISIHFVYISYTLQ